MKNPYDSHERNDNDNGERKRLLPEGFFDISRSINSPKEKDESGDEENRDVPLQSKNRTVKQSISFFYLRWWGNLDPDRRIELGSTVVIACFAVLQFVINMGNNSSATQQTNQLIQAAHVSAYAAQQNVVAANNFAFSTEHINKGIADAVDKLQIQADRMEDSRITAQAQAQQSLDASLDNFRKEQRPWLAIEDVQCSTCFLDTEEIARFQEQRPGFQGFSPIKIEGFSGWLVNTGHTPAVNVAIDFTVHAGTIPFGSDCQPLPNGVGIGCAGGVDSYNPSLVTDQQTAMDRVPDDKSPFIAPKSTVAAPNQRIPIRFSKSLTKYFISLDSNVANGEKPAVYVRGSITYTDVEGSHHYETNFCIFAYPHTPDTFGFCNERNSNTMR